MAYCTIEDMRALLPKNVTIGDDSMTTSLTQPNLPGVNGASVVSTLVAQESIKKSSEEIDASLRPIYVCPLQRIKTVEEELIANAAIGANSVMVYDNSNFDINTLVKIKDDLGEEVHYTGSSPTRTVANIHTVNLQGTLARGFAMSNHAKIYVLKYPEPITFICARLAISLAFDRTFVAEQQPDVSSYGKTQRTQANVDMDKILVGAIRLDGQGHVGSRFARMSVMNRWRTPSENYQIGTNRES
jgi:hypothetical protein